MEAANYKQTSVGLIPNDWEIERFDNIFELFSTNSFSRDNLTYEKTNNEILNIHYGDIHSKFNFEILDCELENLPFIRDELILNQKFNYLKDGDLIISDASEDYDGVGKCIEVKNVTSKKIVSGLHTFLARDNSNKTIKGYRTYIFKNPKVSLELKKIATGISVYSISKSELKKIKIPLPPLPEQEKIAQILSTWDTAIDDCKTIIENLKLRNKGLSQKLLSGKMRVKGFEETKWNNQNLGHVTENFSRRNKSLIDARIYSVTNSNGFVLQSDHFSREVAGSDLNNYKIIRRNEFAYNPARINVGSIAYFSEDIGVISSLYVCFKTNDLLHDGFLSEWLKLEKTNHDINRYGEGGVRVYLWYDLFKTIKINFPDLKEQYAIVNILEKATEELNQYQQKLEKLQSEKKGLMQQLLTGKVRVKI